MEKFKSGIRDLGLDPCRGSEGADGSQVVWRRNVLLLGDAILHNALDKIVTKLKDRYENKESSVIYDMASIIDDKSVADQVVQRVVRSAYYSMDADQMCSELQMFNQFKLHIK